ncbi:MAG: DUF3040 domain-containing protein [Actinomycetales bacterium]|nr:DUF3040 domain-containing protein [Actinomycetales bacterium]
MSLSEHERRVLEQLERELYEGDAQFAKRMGADRQKLAAGKSSSPKRIIAGAAVALSGVAVLIEALIVRYAPIGVVGFGLMVLGLWLATAQFGRLNRIAKGKGDPVSGGGSASNPSASTAETAGSRPGFTEFFERRWDQREP